MQDRAYFNEINFQNFVREENHRITSDEGNTSFNLQTVFPPNQQAVEDPAVGPAAGPSVNSVINVNQAVDNVDSVVENVAAPIEIPVAVKPKRFRRTKQQMIEHRVSYYGFF